MNKLKLNIYKFGDKKRFTYGLNNTMISSIDFDIGFDIDFEKMANNLTTMQIQKYILICSRLKIPIK